MVATMWPVVDPAPLTSGFTLLVGGGLLALIGALLTIRESRQKRYDDRMDKTMKDLDTENKELDEKVQSGEAKIREQAEEIARLRILLRSHNIDPDSKAVTT